MKTKGNRRIIWEPQPGSQTLFLSCPALEVLYHGTRGPGKTDALLMSFAGQLGKGFGNSWTGIIFRQTYPQLADIVAKSERWFRQAFPDAKFNMQRLCWKWPGGEMLFFRHFQRPSDYWNYHGHEYPFIGWEELTSWASPECYLSMFSCCRSSKEGLPRMIRATSNPYGVGHNWVKERFELHGDWRTPRIIQTESGSERVAIHGHLRENLILLKADPSYPQHIIASAANEAMAAAWLEGSWDIIAGGMFSDLWSYKVHVVQPFKIPFTWRIDRSFDWGSSAPFSVGWWAESDGSDYTDVNGITHSTVRGDLFRIHEWYGASKKTNEGLHMIASDIVAGIRQREIDWGIADRVKEGPADTAIFTVENGNSIALDMQKSVKLKDGTRVQGLYWIKADKRPGSRIVGWEHMRNALRNSISIDGRPREAPGLFIFQTCPAFIRTVPSLSRSDKDMDDIDEDSEDHVADETRYRIMASGRRLSQGRMVGGF